MVQLTIRDVPEEVKDALATAASARSQSLQAYALGVLTREASFMNNAAVIVEIEGDVGHLVGDDAPSAAEVLAQERARRA
ncbi:FitA-like ribbon-helix-helix domain-containing protein [Solicola gregarius]|uniref:Antitoxin FitA-like ribbon-helix-helix domain-containing protein n=1 Tax=Solicola gregarius TaxID=2908642 RepID=A0AA46TH13_9ACTN|nr:hypothetical protein [Solicola gregarius]UYM04684.1 hypothetical protein L0C25_19430 [Solicola gregarius]